MTTCVFCFSTTIDYESVVCPLCIDYIENIAHFKGKDLDDEIKNMETMVTIFFILLVGACHTRFNIKTARLPFKK